MSDLWKALAELETVMRHLAACRERVSGRDFKLLKFADTLKALREHHGEVPLVRLTELEALLKARIDYLEAQLAAQPPANLLAYIEGLTADVDHGHHEEYLDALWSTLTQRERDMMNKLADKLAAQPQAKVPEGWKLVPVEPTDEMLVVRVNVRTILGWVTTLDAHGTDTIYRAMLAAAPEPPK